MFRHLSFLKAATFFMFTFSWGYANASEPHFEITAQGGISSLSADDSSIQLNASQTDSLTQTNNGEWNSGTAQIGLGYVYLTGAVQWFPMITPQINVYYLGGGVIEGDVYQFQDPAFDNLAYTVDFQSTRLMFDLKATLTRVQWFSIYALAGAGVSWNTFDLTATPNLHGLACGAIGYEIGSANNTAFVYEAGAGFSFATTDRFAINLEYLFTGFPDINLSGAEFDISAQNILLGFNLAI